MVAIPTSACEPVTPRASTSATGTSSTPSSEQASSSAPAAAPAASGADALSLHKVCGGKFYAVSVVNAAALPARDFVAATLVQALTLHAHQPASQLVTPLAEHH